MKVCLVCIILCLVFSSANAGLRDYVQRPEPAFSWEQEEVITDKKGTLYDLHLVSQEWRGITWEHLLQVYVPPKVSYADTMLLFVTGGRTGRKPKDDDIAFGFSLAKLTGSVCAVLYQVPNQPLYDGKTEDDLIAHTFENYLESGDETWPLLFPMVKSAVKAMDALEGFAEERLDKAITGFVITGASKRGWTSWLTAATDSRISATIPLVIDTLNMQAQMDHQLEVWGAYSHEIDDYSNRGLQDQLKTEEGKKLTALVDPYSYRDVLTVPKLSIIGTNDPYWVLDALNLYWDGLKDPKYVLYVPNSGHGLEDRERALAGLTGFYRLIASGQSLPKLTWTHTEDEKALKIAVKADQQPISALLWTTASPTQDFRPADWVAVPLQRDNDGGYSGTVMRSLRHYTALFAELTFVVDDGHAPLSTQLAIGKPVGE